MVQEHSKARRTASGATTAATPEAPSTRRSTRSTPANVKDLKIAWRWKAENFGRAPDFNWEVTPLMVGGVLYFTAGTRRDAVAVDAATGETLWMYRLDEGERGARAVRTNNRGLAYWTDGKGDERILLISPGYQLIALNAKTGVPIPGFGKNGIVELTEGLDRDVVKPGQIGASSPAIVVRDTVVVGAALLAGTAPAFEGERAGLHSRLRRPHGQAHLDLQDHSPSGRIRQRDLGERFLEVYRQHRRMGAVERRRRTRLRLHSGGNADRRFLRRQPARRQSVSDSLVCLDANRQTHLALPTGPS